MSLHHIKFSDTEYISSKEVAKVSGYTHDYISRLCRAEKISGKRVGRVWYVKLDSLNKFVERQKKLREDRADQLVQERKRDYQRELVKSEIKKKTGIEFTVSNWVPVANRALVFGLSVFLVFGSFLSLSSAALQDQALVALSHARSEFLLNSKEIKVNLQNIAIDSYAFISNEEMAALFVRKKFAEVASVRSVAIGSLYDEVAASVRGAHVSAKRSIQTSTDAAVVFGNLITLNSNEWKGVAAYIATNFEAYTGDVVSGTRVAYQSIGFSEEKLQQSAIIFYAVGAEELSEFRSNFYSGFASALAYTGETYASFVKNPVNTLQEIAQDVSTSIDYGSYRVVMLFEEDAPRVPGDPSIGFTAVERTVYVGGGQTVEENITQNIVQNITQNVDGLSQEEFDTKIAEFEQRLSAFQQQNTTQIFNNYTNISQTNKIDKLGNVTITNSSFSDGSISNASVSATNLSASGSTTLSGGLAVTGTGTSTFSNGIDLQDGCFAIGGVCITGTGVGGGSVGGAVATSSAGQVGFFATDGATITGTSSLTIATSTSFVGVGTSTPLYRLDIFGDARVAGLLDASYVVATSSTATSTFAGSVAIGTTTSQTALTVDGGIYLASTTPLITSNVLYNQGGTLYFNGSVVGSGGGVGDHAFPFTLADAYGATAVSTSTLIALEGGFVSTASSTVSDLNTTNFVALNATTTNATSTNLFTTNLTINSLTGPLQAIDGVVSATSTISSNFIENLSGTNTGDVTLAGAYDYITIAGQTITRNQIDLTTDVTGVLPDANVASDITLDNLTQITTRNASDLQNFGDPFYTFLSATNTDALSEGSTNLYFTNNRADQRAFLAISGTTTTAIDEGTNLYFTNDRVAALIAGTTTDAIDEGATNFYWTQNRFDLALSATSTLPNLTTLAGLSSFGTAAATTTSVGGLRIDNLGLRVDTLASCDTIDTDSTGHFICGTDENTQLSEEQVEDFVGGMVSGNTETLITVTYEDSDGTLDFVVDNNLANYDNSTSGFITSQLAFPWTVASDIGGVSTSTTLGFLNGFVSTASSTVDGTLTVDTLVATGTATSTFAAGLDAERINTTATSTFSGLQITGGLNLDGLTGILRGTAGQVSASLINLASDITGTLPVGNGGTGVTTFGGTNQVLYTTAADTLASEAAFTYNETTNELTVGNIVATNSTTTSATTTNLNLAGVTANRILQADGTGNVVSVADLTSWITGGTGITVADDGDGTTTLNLSASFNDLLGVATSGSAAGSIFYEDASGTIVDLGIGTNGQVLKVTAGFPAWGADNSGGGGGSGLWATTTNDQIIYPSDSSDIVVIGSSATSSNSTIFEVRNGNAFFSGNVGIGNIDFNEKLNVQGVVAAQSFTATSTTATSSLQDLSVTDLAITNLTNTLLKTDATGYLVPAVAGTDYAATDTQLAFPWTVASDIGGVSTSTTLGFLNGFVSTASSTVSDLNTTNFVALNATTTNATSTNLFTTNLTINSLTGPLQAIDGVVSATSTISSNFIENLSGTNTGDVTLAGAYDYITIAGQTITRNQIDLTTDVTGVLPDANVASDITLDNLTQITTRNASDLQNFGDPFYTFLSATNTDALSEGSTNLYFTNNRADQRAFLAISGTTTTAIDEGTNLYFTNDRVAALIAGTTTDAIDEGATNFYWTQNRFDLALSATSTLPNLTTLAGLSSFGTAAATTTSVGGLRIDNLGLRVDTLASCDTIDTDSTGHFICGTDENTQLSEEQVEDFVGGMVSGNTETLITVTYEDSDGTLDFVVDNNLANYDNSTSGFITSQLAFPWTVASDIGGVSTSTTLGFLNGFVSTASSTFTNNLTLSSLGAGGLATDANGLVYSAPTTTFSGGLTYTNGNVTADLGTSIDDSEVDNNITLDNLTQITTRNASDLQNFGDPFYTFLSATNTDALSEGSTNLYFTNNRADQRAFLAISGTTTTAIDEGTNLYFTNDRVAALIAGTTTDAIDEGATNFYWTQNRFDLALSATSTLPNLTTLAGLSSFGTAAATTTSVGGLRIDNLGLRVDTLASCDTIDTDSTGHFICGTDENTQLSEEQVEDFVGGMVSGNTETLITVTYEDSDGTLDFVVDNNLANYDNSTSGFITSQLAFPWTVASDIGGVSTSTTLGFLNGFVSTASSTFTNNLTLSSLGAGGLATDANGLVYSAPTTTFSGGLTYTNGNVTADLGTSIDDSEVDNNITLDNLTQITTRNASDLQNFGDPFYTFLSATNTDALSEGSTNLYFTDERVDDRLNALIVDGTGISTSYDDGANTFTINSTITDTQLAFPWTVASDIGGVSTSTTLGFLNGFVSTASSTVDAQLTVDTLVAENTTATSTFPNINVSNFFRLGSDSIIDLTGSGLQITSHALSLDTTGDYTWSGSNTFATTTFGTGGTGDSVIEFAIDSTAEWSIGVDDSDGDNFVISEGDTLGTNNSIVITNNGLGTGTTTFSGGVNSPNITVSGVTGTLLKTDATGYLVPAVAGTDYAANQLAFPWTAAPQFGAGSVSTSTLLAFTNGFVSTASSTVNAQLTVDNIVAESTTATSTFAGGLTVDTNTLVVDYSTNQVGINTDSPQAKLDITNSGPGETVARFGFNNNANIRIGASANDYAEYGFTAGYSYISTTDTSCANGCGLILQPSNVYGVGIGTTSPAAKFAVAGAGFFDGDVTASRFTATSTTATSSLQDLSVTDLAITNLTNTLLKTDATGYLVPAVAGTDYAATDTQLAFPWTVAADIGGVSTSTTLGFLNGFVSTASSTVGGDFTFGSTAFDQFQVVGGELTTTSAVDVFTASSASGPTERLQITTRNAGTVGLQINGGTSGSQTADLFQIFRLSGDSDASFVVDGSANVSIGTSSPASKLTVWGDTTGNIAEFVTNASTTALSISATGNATTTVTGLNINGSATSTSNVGFNITTGCYAVNGVCVGGGGGGVSALDDLSDAVTSYTDDSIYLGSSSGGSQGANDDGNTALGENTFAAFDNSGADFNTALGFAALTTATSSDNNTAVGYNALTLNQTGEQNTAVGSGALDANTFGSQVTGLGYLALSANTTGGQNTAVGALALDANTTGSNNVALGYGALGSNTTANANTALGRSALRVSTGSNNTGVGNAAYWNATGASMTGVGQGVAFQNTSGGETTLVGYRAAYGGSSYAATQITAVGSEALYNIDDGGDDNVAFGYRAGYGNTSGANNLYLGFQAGDNVTTGSNNIVIGYDVDAPSATASNQLTIGNLIFGTGIDATGTGISSGNIGIGTSTPATDFAVAGNVWLDSNVITYASSTASTLTVDYRTRATTTIPASTAWAWTIATSTTAQPIVEISTDGETATTSFIGSVDISDGAFQYDYGSNKTSIERLDLGPVSFEDDAGKVSWIDLPVTTSSATNTPQAFSAQIDSNELLTVYAQSDGQGNITDARVVVGTSTDAILGSSNIPFGSLIVADGILCVDDGSGDNCDDSARTAGQIYAESSSVTAIDLAENYPTRDISVEAGEIVMLDVENAVFVERYNAEAASSTMPLGIISTEPGILLGGFANDEFEGERLVPVALSGRVPVKVSGEGGSILIGDRIAVSKVNPGYGTKATSTSYTVGIALENFSVASSTDEGEITVFVDLERTIAEEDVFFAENGNIGIGTTSPLYDLHVAGDVAATGFVNTSTKEVKTDISYLGGNETEDILNKIKDVKVATYNYITDVEVQTDGSTSTPNNPIRLGLIAEEAPREVLSVSGDGVDIYKLASFTLAGVQEIASRLEGIETRLESIETFLATGEAPSAGFGSSIGAFGIEFIDGITQIANLAATNFSVGSPETPSGITLYDEVTGEPYCLTIRNGEMTSTAGECTVVSSETDTATTTPPVAEGPSLVVIGNNPAYVELGAQYSDLGARFENQEDNFTIFTFVNGEQVDEIALDTGTSTTYTIRYEATDAEGQTAFVEREVVVGEESEVIVETPTETSSTTPVTTGTTTPPTVDSVVTASSTPDTQGTSTPPLVEEPEIVEEGVTEEVVEVVTEQVSENGAGDQGEFEAPIAEAPLGDEVVAPLE